MRRFDRTITYLGKLVRLGGTMLLDEFNHDGGGSGVAIGGRAIGCAIGGSAISTVIFFTLCCLGLGNSSLGVGVFRWWWGVATAITLLLQEGGFASDAMMRHVTAEAARTSGGRGEIGARRSPARFGVGVAM